MKFIVTSILFVTMLFSIEKQIILGSYEIDRNAKNQLKLVKEYVSANQKIRELVKTHKVEVRNEKIGKYQVVSIGYYNNYIGLFRSIKELKKEYNDAYTLDKNIPKPLESTEQEKEVLEEAAVEENVVVADEEVIEKTDEETSSVEEKAPVEEVTPPTPLKEEKTDIEQQITQEIAQEPESKQEELKEDIDEIYYYILGGLAAVLLMILLVAMIIKNKVNNEGRENKEID